MKKMLLVMVAIAMLSIFYSCTSEGQGYVEQSLALERGIIFDEIWLDIDGDGKKEHA